MVVNQISSLLSTVKSKRGVICDLNRDWQLINIPLYLQNNIPFFYLWDFEAQSDQRFSRLNPALNLTYWATRQGTQLSLIPDLEEPDINKIVQHATKLDHFFQEAHRKYMVRTGLCMERRFFGDSLHFHSGY